MSMRCGTEGGNGGCGCGHKDFPGRDEYVTGAALGDEMLLDGDEETDKVLEEM